MIYDQDYIRKCFDVWYLSGRPSSTAFRKMLPEHPSGKRASIPQINRWMTGGFWDLRADELDAQARLIADEGLIQQKAQMLREHQEMAAEVTKKALDHIRTDGFDSSSAAVKAFFDGLQEQRKVVGFSDLLEKLDKMTNNDVEREIINLLNRASENDQVIDSVSTEVEQLENNNED